MSPQLKSRVFNHEARGSTFEFNSSVFIEFCEKCVASPRSKCPIIPVNPVKGQFCFSERRLLALRRKCRADCHGARCVQEEEEDEILCSGFSFEEDVENWFKMLFVIFVSLVEKKLFLGC